MIPVRVPAAAVPVLAGERRLTIAPGHPLADALCPACDGPLTATPVPEGFVMEPGPVVLILAGIAPADRAAGGWTTGGAVAVHEACAGVAP